MTDINYTLQPIGFIRSELKTREDAPRQGYEGAPDVWIEITEPYDQGLYGISIGDNLVVITWFHKSTRDNLLVYPRGDTTRELTGVFTTRSPDRPNPIGLHRVTVREIHGNRMKVGPIEALDGTPVIDIKSVLSHHNDS